MTCAACGADLGRPLRVGRRDTCPQCRVDLHSCRQCRFHGPSFANQCREPQAEPVLDKVSANFCDYFAMPEARPGAGAAGVDSASSRAALERLFRRR